MKTMRRFSAKAVEGDIPFLFVYVAGHGCADQHQYFVVNHDKQQLVPIEAKLRVIANKTQAHIISIYDVCRQEMKDLKNLKRGGGPVATEDDQTFGDEYCYMHICAQPGKLVDGDSTMAKDLIEHIDEAAQKDKHGLLEIPTCLVSLEGLEKTMNGESYTIKYIK